MLKILNFVENEMIRHEFGLKPHSSNQEFCLFCLFHHGEELIENYPEDFIDAVFGYPSFQHDGNIDENGIVQPSGKFYLKEDFDCLVEKQFRN